ncbi:disease resistance protein RPV1-like [Vitis riparia]|uniref:disease resistance protein RPV1-like n=1 Tax=Vitis riparia TaxID=96939 RepID=UPI00155A8171|nr:disease resistance protein RPV1-like [Vitis riparia]XP_034676382.1 disease resistance protein RPV1-like [Vitis riparia]XP_034676383.1 disease resistance protein RPV1-like [Vitis riparia]XP_034676384.1 disease resistance protein RPV1-like [Vitis riparia]XP_034676385.1 disease resistance protein RPV1-like [Vitis riparia]XP_034676386.1 disease resistance protein RPV1-like [Vitis riparia]XP_034676387.1 disease resistance protein RPV1-like [Vitis riparia]
MTSTNTQPSSSSSKSTHQFSTYEVFLSFRGEDTRYGFIDHLYEALISHGICTFRDDVELERGGVIASELLHAIEESNIFVIIFSENYAASRWCLDELVKINECKVTKQRLILPIFYHVDPSEVRKQTGSYGEALADHGEEANQEKKEKIQKWRAALTEAANLAGYVLQKYGYEARLIKEITYDILTKLNRKLLYVGENIVGMDFRLEQLKSFINIESNDVRMVGIYGLGGIGKTTISKVIYNNISHQFESSIFLENVRERSNDHSSLLQLQKELLNGVVKEKIPDISNVHEGVNVIRNRFGSKKVLVILDDVDKLEQLKFLAGKHDWFGVGSRIIITSRNQHWLIAHGVDASYEVEALNYKESIQLFCRHAFKQTVPKNNYVDLSDHVVDYVKGLPLALEVLGSFLFSKSVFEWESTLQKLKRKPNMEVQNVLRISFDGLDEIEQEIFLDVACFFKGWNKNDVVRLVEHALIGIRVLSDKCLITLFGNTISMHDLVQEMGREIVRHEHPKEPGKWSRLWDPEDICRILRKKTGTEAIEGIFLDMSRSREISFTTEAFKRMERLRLLKVYWSCDFVHYMGKEYQKPILPKDFEFPSHDLRYLHWEGYSLKSLPANFDGQNLIELNLKQSSIEQLWQGKKDLEELKILNLSKSHQLNKIPHFLNMLNLEQLNLELCGSVDKVDSSIGFLKKLTFLNLRGCAMIRSLPSTIKFLASLERLYLDGTAIQDLPFAIHHLTLLRLLSTRDCKNLRSLPRSICKLKSLEYIYLSGCSNLEIFPEIMEDMECLKELDLSGTHIQELPSSIEYVIHLTSLRLRDCKKLRSLTSSICRLKSLEELDLYGCSNLETFPEIMEDMECLKKLDLSGTCIKEIPSSVEYISHLTFLRLAECKNLTSLPSSICRLKYLKDLNLFGCSNFKAFPEIMEDMKCLKMIDLSGTGIKGLPSSIECLNHLTSLRLVRCKNLRSLPNNICRLKSLKELHLYGCSNLEAFPEIMENMECLNMLDLSGTGIKELPSSIRYLNHLNSLRLVECENFRSLPGNVYRLKYLKDLDLYGCSNLETFPEIMENMEFLKELDFSETGIKDLPSSIGYLNNLTFLRLVECKNLRSLPTSICRLKSLIFIFLNGCSNLETFPEIMEDMECLKMLDLSGTGVKELPSSIEYLSHLTDLRLVECKNLRSLPSSICRLKSLEELNLCGCSNLETFPEIMEDMECLMKLDLSGTCIKELPSSIEYINHLTSLRMVECENLRSLPSSICRLKSLEELNLCGCSKLETFPEIMEDMECLMELDLSGTCIKELPSSIEYINHLTSLRMVECENLRSLPSSICRLKSLEELNLCGCSNLETFPEIMEDMECLMELDLSGTCIKELPSSIEYINYLTSLRMVECKNLRSLPSSICRLKSLKELNLCGCSNLESFPEIMEDMECLMELDLSGTCIKELPSSIEYINHLTSLRLVECRKLRSLTSNICRLKSLKYLFLRGCSNLETFPEIMEDMECLVELDLKGTCIKELPLSFEYLNHLTYLSLQYCQNLRSLSSSICRLKSLEYVNLYGCSNLENFPEIMEGMECLKNLDLSGTGINGLPSSIEYLNHLTSMRLVECETLRSLPSSICRLKSLEYLNLYGCSNLEIFPEIMEDMECLKNLDLSGTGIKELSSSIGYLNHLTSLRLKQCKNLRSLPSNICRLKSLTKLCLSGCPNIVTEDMENLRNLGLSETQNLMDGVTPNDLWCLSSLVELDLSKNNIRHIPAAITQLRSLEHLNISHCKMLEEIPELPSSVREIDAHGCTSLGTLSDASSLLWSSLLKWFKKVEPPLEWGSINLDSNGIPGWVLHQEMGSKIRIELPMNWYQDDHFLGFGFFCLYQPDMDLNSSLKFDEEAYDYMGAPWCECYWIHGSESEEVWVVYYPKISIGDQFHSNQYMHLQASFDISILGCSKNIKSCGIHLIYSQDLQHNHISLDDEHNHMPMSLNLLENSGDNRSTAKHEKLREVITNYISITNRSTDQQINNNKTYLKPVSTYKLNHQNFLELSFQS